MTLKLYEDSAPFAPPFFSIIICTFNRAHLLPRALDSVLQQTESSWEVIVVDDGSTDNTTEVVSRYLQAAPNIRYMRHSNRGLAISRNVGIAAAIGEYVTFLDSDDWYTPDHLANRRALLEEHPGVELIYGGCQIIGNSLVPDKDNPEIFVDLHDPAIAVGGTFVSPRQFMVQIGGFPIWSPYSMDGDLFEALKNRGTYIVRTEHRSYIYDRTTPDSMAHIVADGGYEALEEYQRTGHWNSPRAHAKQITKHLAEPTAESTAND